MVKWSQEAKPIAVPHFQISIKSPPKVISLREIDGFASAAICSISTPLRSIEAIRYPKHICSLELITTS